MSTPTPPKDPRDDGKNADLPQDSAATPDTAPATTPDNVPAVQEEPVVDNSKEQDSVKRQLKALDKKVSSSIATGTWAAIIVGAVALLVLLAFIVQNQQPVQLQFFNLNWEFPLGIGMLLASILGALLMACIALIRMFQLRIQVGRQRRLVKKQAKLMDH